LPPYGHNNDHLISGSGERQAIVEAIRSIVSK
jgi:hypothetical protein